MVAKFFFILGLVINFISAVALFIAGLMLETMDPLLAFVLFLLILILGSFGCWLSSLLLYGYGELIDNKRDMNDKMQ